MIFSSLWVEFLFSFETKYSMSRRINERNDQNTTVEGFSAWYIETYGS